MVPEQGIYSPTELGTELGSLALQHCTRTYARLSCILLSALRAHYYKTSNLNPKISSKHA